MNRFILYVVILNSILSLRRVTLHFYILLRRSKERVRELQFDCHFDEYNKFYNVLFIQLL